MTEYIVNVPDEEAEYFIARFGLEGTTLMGYHLTGEIVRCRDCTKWHHIDTEDGIRYGECDEWKRADSYCVPATNEDGFCAWSARKEVDNAD